MRYQFVLGFLVMGALLFMPVESQDVCRKGRKRYQVGEEIPTDNPCSECHCLELDGEASIECVMMTCAVYCPGTIIDDGTCCGKCEDPVCKQGRKKYDIGQSVPTKDPCEDCTCIQNGDDEPEVMCALMMCDMMCPGAIMDDGTCCGKCEEVEPVCKQGRKKYAIGESVPTGNPCEECTCEFNGDTPDLMCAMMACVMCEGIHIDDGSCCGKCEEPVCKQGRKTYDVGESVPTGNPCEDCMCALNGDSGPEVICAMMMCDYCPGITVDDGSCCGSCEPPQCRKGGKTYQIGEEVPTKDPCETCSCENAGYKVEIMCFMMACAMYCEGEIVDDGTCCGQCVMIPEPTPCDLVECPKLSCPKKYQFQNDGDCCPQCKCRVKDIRKPYLPGPVGDKCDNCFCDGSTGKVVCAEQQQSCPKIECVDPIRDDNCCYHCPNGQTCSKGKTIIKRGEYKRVRNDICTCLGDPWYPTAFCASSKVSTRKYKNFADFLAPFMKP